MVYTSMCRMGSPLDDHTYTSMKYSMKRVLKSVVILVNYPLMLIQVTLAAELGRVKEMSSSCSGHHLNLQLCVENRSRHPHGI